MRSCKNLKRDDAMFDPRLMQPFFHYNFYKFDHSSAIASGDSPEFNFEHKYELENTRELDDYMKNQILIINFLDKGVDFGEVTQLDNLKDYIGSVRISLRDLATGSMKVIEDDHFPVKNHLNKTMGTAAVKISFNSADSAQEVIAIADERTRMRENELIMNEVTEKIVKGFAEFGFDDFDMIVDMLLKKNKENNQVSLDQFKQFVIEDCKVPITD